jgi:hypothetical protein
MSEQVKHTRTWVNLGDIIAIAMMSLASFLVETTLGLVLLPFIPFPLMGGLLSGFFDAILIFTANYLVPRKGAPFIFAVLLLTMSTVTPSFGPVGAYKILIGVGLGLTIEILLSIIGRSGPAGIVAVAVAFGGSIPMTYFAWRHYGIPGVNELRPVIFYLTPIYAALGGVGAAAGLWIYNHRLSRHSIVKRLREGSFTEFDGDSPDKGQ